MLIDDLWGLGLKNLIDLTRPYHVIQLPFPVAPWCGRDGTDVARRQFSLYARNGTDLEKRLTPVVDGMCDGTWAKSPYDQTILFGPGDTGCLVVISENFPDLGCQRYLAISVFRDTYKVICKNTHHAIMAVPGFCQRSDDDGSFTFGPYNHDTHDVDALAQPQEYRDLFWKINRCLFASPAHDRCFEEMKKMESVLWEYIQWLSQIISAQPMHIVTAFSLMNAKNVAMQPVAIDEKLRKARVKRGKCPGVEYHVLKLNPFANMRPRKQGGVLTDELMPIHWVRGHFKIFTTTRPLFGRFHGRFWWQPHVSGRNKERVIVKSYEVVRQRNKHA